MPLTKPLPDASMVAENTAPSRDRAVDVARLAALVVVMFGHCALLLATIDTGGLRIGNLLGELPAIAPITWVVQVMPLFFLAGGAAGAYGWRPRNAVGHVAVHPGAATVPARVLVSRGVDGRSRSWRAWCSERSLRRVSGRECVALLWFLGVYLVALAFVPALTRMRTGRAVAIVVASLLAAAAAVDGIRIAVGTPEAGLANFLIVWLIPVVIGVAYARGLIGPRAALAVAASAFTAQMLLAIFGPYELSLVVTGAERMSNVGPPTLLLALHCTWMSCRVRGRSRARSGGGPHGRGSGTSSRWATGER